MLTLSDAARRIRARELSPTELTEACLRRIDDLNPRLNAFITVTPESALAAARRAEADITRGYTKGPLHGIPIALKDNVATAGVRTTAASAVRANHVPRQDAEIVRRLEAAGAVILGKLNLHEFAYGGSSVVSAFGPPRNPWDLSRSTGGSSGGSAAAVAAGLCCAAIGTDTGGSVRQPAAFCGIVGLKATYGLVSNRGIVPLAPSMDHAGPMTVTVRDAALMLQVIAGYDPDDPTSVDLPVPDYDSALTATTPMPRLGVPRALFYDDLHPDVRAALDAALAVLEDLGAHQRDLGPLDDDIGYAGLQRSYSTILTAEAYAYHRDRARAHPDQYQAETLRRIQSGARIEAAAYEESRRDLERRRRDLRAFESVDLLITPTTPVPPFTIADLVADPATLRNKEVITLRNTRPFNLLGLPTISVPCGFTREGLPVGLQITGPHGGEVAVLRLAYAYEQATDWHTRHPPIPGAMCDIEGPVPAPPLHR